MTLDDVGPGVTTQRYHNNERLILLEINCIIFSLYIHNSLGISMCKFHAFQSKTEESAYFLNIPRIEIHLKLLKHNYKLFYISIYMALCTRIAIDPFRSRY